LEPKNAGRATRQGNGAAEVYTRQTTAGKLEKPSRRLDDARA
jgi:hypothetical protein